MLKKFWNITQYIILLILLAAMANALYLKSLRHILGGILFITFWITMILDNKFQNKNKFVSFMYYTSGAIILILNIVAFFTYL